jgi:hypothetical protein
MKRAEEVMEILVVPTSAQQGICRRSRYADVAKKGLLRAFFGAGRSA